MHNSDRVRVLVVEDQALIRIHTQLALEDAGFAVVEACNAADALDRLAENPDIGAMFTDVSMPGAIDGLELAHRARQQHPHLSIVVTSGQMNLPADMLPVGGVFVAKPFTAAQLTRALNQAPQ